MITLICVKCKKPFDIKPYRRNKAICCSRACLWHITKAQREPQRLKSIIGKIPYNKNVVKHNCLYCSKEFYDSPCKKRKYCSKACVNKPIKAVWKAKYSTVRKNMLRRDMIKQCEKCGYGKEPRILGIHHKDRNRHNNNADNLVILCPNCHSIEHMKHIPHGFKE